MRSHMLRPIVLFLTVISLLGISSAVQADKKTDAQEYRHFCSEMSKKDSLFRDFRRQAMMTSILERNNKNTGAECIAYIETNSPTLTCLWDLFRENDRIGNPITVQYLSAGTFSSATLSHVKIAADLQTFFMPIENLKIVEIGGGYGGLCRILTQVFNVKDYTIVDWPEPLQLAKKYLDHYQITTVKYLTPDKLDQGIQADLVVCSHLFSLFRKDLQERYLEQIIKQTPRGYMICNYVAREGMPTMTPKELSMQLKRLHHGLQSFPENPKTSPCSWLNVWND